MCLSRLGWRWSVLVVLEGFLRPTLIILMGFLWRLMGVWIAGVLYVDLYT